MSKRARLSVKISEVEQMPGLPSRRRMTRALAGSPSGGTMTTVGRKYQTRSPSISIVLFLPKPSITVAELTSSCRVCRPR